MRRLVRRFMPFTTFWGAALFAWRYRHPIMDWARWSTDAAPRVVEGRYREVWDEARSRAVDGTAGAPGR